MHLFIYLFIYCLTTQVTCQAYKITLHFIPIMILNEVYKWIFFNCSRALVGSGLLCASDGPSHRPLPDNTQHSQQTNIHAPCGIRTRNPSKRVAAYSRLRPRGHRDQLNEYPPYVKSFYSKHFVIYRPYVRN